MGCLGKRDLKGFFQGLSVECRVGGGCYEATGAYFKVGVKRVLGDGQHTRFWVDIQDGDAVLKFKFTGLFCLSTDKMKILSEMRE